MREPKVFCIGCNKTGTSSLADALYLLGYRLTGAPLDFFDYSRIKDCSPERARRLQWEHMPSVVEANDAFQDTPWFEFYRELDQRYPGSKFILTTRDPARWAASMVRHFGQKHVPDHQWIFGVPYATGHEEALISHFNRHTEQVRQYFEGRQDSFLEMDLLGGEGWAKLAPFLGFAPVSLPFPHINQASERDGFMTKVTRAWRNRVLVWFGYDSDQFACWRVWSVVRDQLERLEAILGPAPLLLDEGKLELPAPRGSHTGWLELLEKTLAEVSELRDLLNMHPAAKWSPNSSLREAWCTTAAEMRFLAGGIAANNFRVRTKDGRLVAQQIIDMANRLGQGAARLASSRTDIQRNATTTASTLALFVTPGP